MAEGGESIAMMNSETGAQALFEEELRNGIWPKSVPLWLAAFYMSLFIIRPWEDLVPWLGEIHFERFYALGMIAVVLFSGRKRLRIGVQAVAVLGFFLSLCVATVCSLNREISLGSLYTYLTLMIFFFVLILVICTPYDLIFIAICYLMAMAVYMSKSQWEYFVNHGGIYDMGVHRMVGIESTFGGPNALAASIATSLPMLLFLWKSRQAITAGWPSFWKRWFPRFLVFYAGLSLTSVLLTNSRSGMLSLALFLLLASLGRKGVVRKTGQLLLGVLIIIVIWHVMPQENKARLSTIWNPDAGPKTAAISAQGRIGGYRAGIEMFKRYPMTGVGLGNFIPYRVANIDGIRLNAHNLAGQVLGETGLVGTAGFALMILVLLRNCRKVRVLSEIHRDGQLALLRALTQACRISIAILVFEGLFAHNLLRFNWLWLSAFASQSLSFSLERFNHLESLEAQG